MPKGNIISSFDSRVKCAKLLKVAYLTVIRRINLGPDFSFEEKLTLFVKKLEYVVD